MSEADEANDDPPAPRSRLGDWRMWVGAALPIAAIAYTVHDVDLRDVGRQIAAADPWWVLAAVPVHLLGLWVRAVRWRYLSLSLTEKPLGLVPLFRATALGFMAVNVLPFRLGELARPWLLSRETEVRGSAALGTLVLERAIDFTCVSILGGGVLALHANDMPAWVRTGAVVFVVFSCLPLALIAALRLDERGTLGWIERLARVLPTSIRSRALDLVEQVCHGLGALRGWRATAWVVVHSALLWGLVLPAPFFLGLLAFRVDLPPAELVLAAYSAHVFVALAVAAPSAPGFFGVFHFACREALAVFGVARATAVGYGTVVHLAYWLPVTLVGLVVAVQAGASVSDLIAPRLGKARQSAHR